jgi:hypothetical protein
LSLPFNNPNPKIHSKPVISMQGEDKTIATVFPHKRTSVPSGICGRLPRISRLLALAIKCERLIAHKAVRDYTDLALLGRISKARATQIMNLLNLAPDIQECLLFLPSTITNRDPITERKLRCIVALVEWEEQRKVFRRLFGNDLLRGSAL